MTNKVYGKQALEVNCYRSNCIFIWTLVIHELMFFCTDLEQRGLFRIFKIKSPTIKQWTEWAGSFLIPNYKFSWMRFSLVKNCTVLLL